jgi:iron complex outermembrane receptor protein
LPGRGVLLRQIEKINNMQPKNILLILFLFLFYAAPAQQRNASVHGRITSSDGLALRAKVWLKSVSNAVAADTAGFYSINNIEPGSYTLCVAVPGCETESRAVTLHANQQLLADFSISESEHQLDGITVTGHRTLNEKAGTAGKAGIVLKDLPQSVYIVERQLLDKQQATLMSDVLRNITGVYVMGTSGGTQEEIGGRGYAFSSSNTFKNGVRYNNSVMPELSSLERVEVLKGSNAILYGNVAAGGVLNLVTRKPRFDRGGEISVRMGSFDFFKSSFDLYGPVNNSNKLAFRLNSSYEKANSFRDNVRSERFYANPSLLYKISQRTEILVEADYVTDKRTSDFGTGAVNYVVADLPRNVFLGAPWAYNSSTQQSATVTITHRINNNWSLKSISNYSRYNNELFGTTRPNASGNFIQPDGRWIRGVQRSATDEQYAITQLDLTGTFFTKGIKHQLLVGADADKYLTRSTAYNNLAVYDTINIFDAGKYRRRNDIPDLTRNTLTTAPVTRAGLYLQDLISLTDKLKLLAGLRYTFQRTASDVYYYSKDSTSGTVRKDHAYSPRVGLVYQPSPNVSLFVSYANSFTLNSGIDTFGKQLPPSYLDQYEAGIKTDLFNRLVSANFTVYRIVNSNLAQTLLPVNARYPNAQELAGEVTSKGLELDIITRPFSGFSLLAGYSYNDTRYTRSNIYIEGSALRYNPSHTANLGLQYAASKQSVLKGFSAGFTAFYTGNRVAGRSTRLTVVNDTYKLMKIPDFTSFDVTAGYGFGEVMLRGKISNLFNALSYYVHDDNSVNPVAPRQVSVSVLLKL